IESWTENGIRVSSGREIAADIIVTATGLTMQFLGGITLSIDGAPFDMSEGIVYKGIMLCGVPNFAMTFGYTNASWTLKADLTSLYICRLLARMSQRGYRQCTPVAPTGKIEVRRFMDLNAGYVLRAASSLPQQTTRRPWTLHNNYLRDTLMLKRGRLTNQMTLNNRVVAKN
ncbi:MAG: FAD-containing monooxygenase EthA, partial [Actinomycetota bacterium]